MIETGSRFHNPVTGIADTYEVSSIADGMAFIFNVTKDEACGSIPVTVLEEHISNNIYVTGSRI